MKINNQPVTVLESLLQHGVSRRSFLKFSALTASLLALPLNSRLAFSERLAKAIRPSVIWLHFQECTACTESITRSFSPSLESLLLDMISLEYHETLMVDAGEAATQRLKAAIEKGHYILIIEGSLSHRDGWCTIANENSYMHLEHALEHAALVVAVGTCAAYGGLPQAAPNPSHAASVSEFMEHTAAPLINLPGCPPVPEVITGAVAYYLAYGESPELDAQGRPLCFYGRTVHDRCPRKGSYNAGKFAESFDDEGARKGWCLLHLGCKGPETYNACSTIGWNDGTSSPMHSGHGCLGCSEAGFWDRWGTDRGIYRNLDDPVKPGQRRPQGNEEIST